MPDTTPFLGGYKITQLFGKRPQYYAQFGFAGHEGVDMIPDDGRRDIYAIEDGIVVRDVDPGERLDAYGHLVVIWNKETRRAWWYAHSEENYVELGDQVRRGQKIAKEGSSGNSSGPHLHLGLRMSDEKGNPVNTGNGFKGFIDPLPDLNKLNEQEITSGGSMSALTDFLGTANEQEAINKIAEHLGSQSGKCTWGKEPEENAENFGGYLGSERRSVSQMKKNLESEKKKSFEEGFTKGRESVPNVTPQPTIPDLTKYEDESITIEEVTGNKKVITHYRRLGGN